jgi:hypothetical protein
VRRPVKRTRFTVRTPSWPADSGPVTRRVFLNSYLLSWPVSYQIQATIWLVGVMYERAGGAKTNAVGAYLINQFAQTHQRLLATDPEYQQ